ncbi:deoxycytidylate deaminase [Geomonas silvestris]|uniref:Deoxycytidylate deaminase n=1 Tax=Geomonas silvestris TaxID=2740184 RepID=A0A6V8MGL6_9BACT|nr:anti-phage dCTP deaminase [Geomonas silvestris]GFO59105.1 deoxycytidylate deaminase [Geomonas silvestris]
MATKLKLIDAEKDAEKSKKTEKPIDTILKRRTQEQIIALCGPVGCGMEKIAERLVKTFRAVKYEVEIIKASDLIIEAITNLKANDVPGADGFQCAGWGNEGDRIEALQNMGDFLRKRLGSDAIAQLFIKKISAHRQKDITDEEVDRGEVHKESRRLVWILDSLKHPEEVRLLRMVYDKMFSLMGVLCSFKVKQRILAEKFRIPDAQAIDLIRRDESAELSYGQKLLKTLQHGDFFVRNAPVENERIVATIERYVNIILGDHSITPTHGEYAMYLAQSAAYRSGCMARQVGAAIMSAQNEIVATGYNDVPCYKGGLYTEVGKDERCFKTPSSSCRNDATKDDIKKKMSSQILDTYLKLNEKKDPGERISQEELARLSEEVTESICKKSGIDALTEYCRAVHAEMDAITSAARKGVSLREGTIYVTTFPCHNCAKHIVSSGLTTVYYVEPYEKSMAIDMHGDSISTDDAATDVVRFLPFEGVAPRQYQNRFCTTTVKKVDGKFVRVEVGEDTPAYSQLLDCFVDYETKIAGNLTESGL